MDIHDWYLYDCEYNLSEGTLFFRACALIKGDCTINFYDTISFLITNKKLWGPSNYVYEMNNSDLKDFILTSIKMQSGDVIKIKSKKWDVIYNKI
jgi:hypothetical protein